MLFGIDGMDNQAFNKYQYLMADYADLFFKVTGFGYDNDNDKMIQKHNGIEIVSDLINIYDFSSELNIILAKYNGEVNTLRIYRNKSQHEIHMIKLDSLGSSNDSFHIGFKYKNSSYSIHSSHILPITIILNKMFLNIILKLKSTKYTDDQNDFLRHPEVRAYFSEKIYKNTISIFNNTDKDYYIYLID
jgi:hypothetical protein